MRVPRNKHKETGRPTFQNNDKVPAVKKAKCPGIILGITASTHEEVTERIKQTTITWKRLKKIWKLGKCSIKTKIKFYNAVIKSKLTYAMETMHLTNIQRDRINAFQAKGLRQILKMEPTYINRENTNKKV